VFCSLLGVLNRRITIVIILRRGDGITVVILSLQCNFHCLLQMYEHITAWIGRVAALNDADLEEELRFINKNSLNTFARAIGRIRLEHFHKWCV
jgi:hypothetical protein